MTSNDQDMTDNVKNSFDNVAKIYEETSFLLKDFSKEITGLGFDKEMPNDGIGTHGSTSIDYPKQWPVRYASLFFMPKDQVDKKRYVCITAIFYDDSGELITPCLVTGVIKTSQEYLVLKQKYGVLYDGYLKDKDKFEGKDGKFVELDGKGSVIAQPLLQINSAEEVKNLAQRMVDCWTEKFGEV